MSSLDATLSQTSRRLGFRPRLLLRRLRRDEAGATAVEFGFIAVPFLALVFAIIETAIALWTTQVLETAVGDASRRIYTGEFQKDNKATKAEDLPGKFKDEVCKSVVGLFDCKNKLKIDVQTLASFPGNKIEPPITSPGGEFDSSNFGRYKPPGPNEIVVVRAAVELPVYVSLLNPKQANLANGNRLVMGTATFKTESYTP